METISVHDEYKEETSHFQHSPEFYNNPIRLSKEQQGNPVNTIHEFFRDYHLVDVREILWNWLVAVLTSDSYQFEDPSDRDSILHFYEQIERLVEASSLIDRQVRKNKKENKK